MYMKNLNHRMTLRLDDELDEFVKQMAEQYRITPSDYIRQCVAQSMYGWKRANEIVNKLGPSISTAMVQEVKKDGRDRKTDSDNIV